MDLKCEFCNKNFSTSGNLKYHQKTNKKCKIIQSNNNVVIEDETKLLKKCEFCNKVFTIHILKKHYKHCKQKLENEITNLTDKMFNIFSEAYQS